MPSKKPPPDPKPPILEWIMGGLGLLLTVAILVVMLREAMGPGGPPVIEPRLHAVSGSPGQWRAEVEVRNTGHQTAAAVEIEGVLGDETASATIDYVPAGGGETVTLGFRSDPRASLQLHARGWTEP